EPILAGEERLAGADLLGAVLDHAGEPVQRAVVAQRRELRRHHPLAALAQEAELVRQRLRRLYALPPGGDGAVAIVGMDEQRPGGVDHLRDSEPGDAREGRVDPG